MRTLRFAITIAAWGALAAFPLGGYAGILMVVMGTMMIIGAAIRFFSASAKLDQQAYARPIGVGADLVLSGLLVLFGLGITVFLVYLVAG